MSSDTRIRTPIHEGGNRRRAEDTVVDMLRDSIQDVHTGLQSHINHCAKQQQRVLWAVIGTFGWVVAHSPEIVSLASKIISRTP